MRAWPACCLVFGLSITVAACGTKRPEGDDTGDDGDDTGTVDATPLPPDASCGGQIQPIQVIELPPPDLMIVLDRSGSMTTTVPNTSLSRWDVMRMALNTMATDLEGSLRIGLTEFPSDESCGVTAQATEVPIDLNQAPEIAQYFNTNVPGGATPSSLGLDQALNYYNTIPVNTAGRYVLFATDGEPNCTSNSEVDTVNSVTALANAGIPTYVLGIGNGFSDQNLNDSALAGLVPKPNGPPHYYAATNSMELDAVLETIAGGLAASCTYTLAEQPPVPENVTVTLNGVIIPRSPSASEVSPRRGRGSRRRRRPRRRSRPRSGRSRRRRR
jgi:hypothetical protein